MGIVAESVSPDAAAALEGGSTFESRLAELRQAKAIYDEAVTELRLGKEARAAWDEATADRAKAANELASARQTASDLIEQAKAKADADRSEAAKTLADARASAEATLAKASADAQALLDAAAEESKKAASRTALAGKRMKEAEELKAAADELAADAQAKIDVAIAEQQRFANLISEIKNLASTA